MNPIPKPTGATARRALEALARERHILAALEAVHDDLGDVFQLPLPGFSPVMVAGPEAARFILAGGRHNFLWRAEQDPVTRLLRHGLLVEDGSFHDALRREMRPSLHKGMVASYVETMWRCTDQITGTWQEGAEVDLLVEMRRVALLILTQTLYKADFRPHLDALWSAILRAIRYISPGPWLIWRGVPRPGYRRALRRLDAYLYQLIAARRASLGEADDVLGGLIASGMAEGLIRDQLLTLLIAGHDTSTALLAWALYLLTTHREAYARVQDEVDGALGAAAPTLSATGQLGYLDRVIKETLRLYPPIHLGSRIAARDVALQGYTIPAGTRVLYSIYLTHRHKAHWEDPQRFDPERFSAENERQRAPYTFLPFGGGPRNCIGTAFAQVEARIVLARVMQQFELRFVGGHVRPHMGATLEPHPGVRVAVQRRRRP